MTWGSELTMGYEQRTRVFGVRNVMCRVGIVAFYGLPLLPWYSSGQYTPQVLRDAVCLGAILTLLGLATAIVAAPAGMPIRPAPADSAHLLVQSVMRNKPLLLFFTAFGCLGLSSEVEFGLAILLRPRWLSEGGRTDSSHVLDRLRGRCAGDAAMAEVNPNIQQNYRLGARHRSVHPATRRNVVDEPREPGVDGVRADYCHELVFRRPRHRRAGHSGRHCGLRQTSIWTGSRRHLFRHHFIAL